MKLCILCNAMPAIQNSHIVPKFVVRRLKAGTPHQTLRHSTNLSRVEQDGWKAPYLCTKCEGKFSAWEDAFCRDIYDPLTKQGAQTFALNEKLALFAISLHFRCIRYCTDAYPQRTEQRVSTLYGQLRAICLSGSLPAAGIHSFIEILKPVTDAALYPPGINTYFFEAIDLTLFPWVLPSSQTIWVSYVKIPGVAFFLADADLERAASAPGLFNAYRLGTIGALDTSAHHGVMISMVRDTVVRRAFEIQENYEAMPEQQLTKMTAKIQAEPNKEQFRGHQSYLLDMALLQQVLATQNAAKLANG